MSAIEQLKTLKKEIKLPYIPLWELSNNLEFDDNVKDCYSSFDKFVNDMGKTNRSRFISGWKWGNLYNDYPHIIGYAMSTSQWKDEHKPGDCLNPTKLSDLRSEQQEYAKKIDILEIIGITGKATNEYCVMYILTNKAEEPKIRKWLAPIFKEIDLLSG